MTSAATRTEFAQAWIREASGLWGCFPSEEYDLFKEALTTIIHIIIRRAITLDLPDGEGWVKLLDEHEFTLLEATVCPTHAFKIR